MKVRPLALIIHNNCLLTLRYNYSGSDVYMLPGGNVDPGETLSQTIQRELNEELGIHIEVHDFLGMGEVISWLEKPDMLHCFFSATMIKGTPTINPTQCSAREICWIDLQEIPTRVFYPNIPAQLSEYLTTKSKFGYIGVINQPEIR